MTAVLVYVRQWLWYSWYTVGLAFVTTCWITRDPYLRQALVPPQEAVGIWRSLKPRWRAAQANAGHSKRTKGADHPSGGA